MEDHKKSAKKIYQEKSRPYLAWQYNFYTPILMIVAIFLNIVGFRQSVFGILILIFAIFAHIKNSQLGLGAQSYVGPIMIYAYELVTVVLLMAVNSGSNLTMVAQILVLSSVSIALLVIAVVFFFITASKIKKQFPSATVDYREAREEYREARRRK